MSDKPEITIQQSFDNFKCPMCEEKISLHVTGRVENASVRHSSTEDLTKKFSMGVDFKIIKIYLTHQCATPKVLQMNP